ncbi:MAG: ATP-binding cassette domain-containing protein [Puniceicoccales bacterium]|jgi:ATPase subunit of ABC transporter with duplicated ATPase domains|nr:ATP-binding cassette domain-containing protein [Puniceicoccales bacterium]
MSSASLALHNAEFSYSGAAPLFSGLTVQFPFGWTGVVGANGSGKTTLLKILAGEFLITAGTMHRQGSTAYVVQRTDDLPDQLEEFLWAPDSGALKSRLRIGDDWPERWETLSHGERKRAQVAIVLWSEPDILALDEPTNHIDADARELLVQVLREFTGIGLLVSHDRELLDELCTNCLILDPPDAVLRPGNVTEALAQQGIDEQTAQDASDTLSRAAVRLQVEAQRRRVVADQKAAAARGSKQRKNPMYDSDGRDARNRAKLTGKDVFAGKLAAQMGRRVEKVEAQRAGIIVKKRYETGIWVDGASYSPRDFLLRLPAGNLPLGEGRQLHFPELAIGGSDRIAITGANGSGKSTLLRHILANLQLSPDRLVSIPQEITAEESRILLESIRQLPETERGRVMTTVSRLGSRPGRLLDSAQPSPGEVRKLLLALGIVRSPHLIVMDEPTNHMDLPSILCLEEALADCPCAMLLVSHDKVFLNKVTRIGWHLAEKTSSANRDTYLEILHSPS